MAFFSICCTIIFIWNINEGTTTEIDFGLGFVNEPEDVVVSRGKTVVIPCKTWIAKDISLINITWLYNGQVLNLEGDNRRYKQQDGALVIKKVKHKHSDTDVGQYQCLLHTDVGALLSKAASLRIANIAHNFTVHPLSQEVVENSLVRLSCSIECVPSCDVSWQLNDQFVLPDDRHVIIQHGDEHVVYVTTQGVQDNTVYRCVAHHPTTRKERVSNNATLTIVPHNDSTLLRFLSPQPTHAIQVLEHRTTTLECSAVDPYPALVSWTAQDENNTNLLNTSIKPGLNLVQLTNVQRNASGTYTCHARARNTQLNIQQITLQVNTKLKLIKKAISQVFPVAKTIRFRCDVEGLPVPTVTWYKDGHPVYINGRIKHNTSVNGSIRFSELLVSSTITDDSGVYQCLASNDIETITDASRLVLNNSRGHPTPPSNISCSSVSANQILVMWDKSSTLLEKDIKAFSIHYSRTEGGEEYQQVTPPNNRSSIVEKLSPFTNYTFSLRVYSETASDFSDKVTCQTGEEAPITAPTLQLEPASSNSLRVSWSSLPTNKTRGVITEYKIQWRLSKSQSTNVDHVKGDVFNYVISGLQRGKTYDIRVLPATSIGWPHNINNLPWTTYEMKSGNATPLATSLQDGFYNSTSILIKWTSVICDGYKLYYKIQNSNLIGPIILGANDTMYLLNNLMPNTSYEVMLLGYNEHGDGDVTTRVYQTKNGDEGNVGVVTPPEGLFAEPITSTSIRLTWIKQNMSYYTICYNPVQNSLNVHSSFISCITSHKNEALISKLKPYTLYEFKVKNENQSVYSQTVECVTLEDVPSVVTDIEWIILNKTSLAVKWKEPAVVNGVVTAYYVAYTHNPQLPFDKWNVRKVPANKYNTELSGLELNTEYTIAVRAATSAGMGDFHAISDVVIKPFYKPIPTTVSLGPSQQDNHHIGVIVGISIGVCCIIICIICIMCRRHCIKNARRQTPVENGCAEAHEMELYPQSPQSQPQSCSSTSVTQHIDSKGHHPNGARLPPVSNGRMVHITENPRYDPAALDSPLLGLQRASQVLDASSTPLLNQSDSSFPPLCNQSDSSNPHLLNKQSRTDVVEHIMQEETTLPLLSNSTNENHPSLLTKSSHRDKNDPLPPKLKVLDQPEFKFSDTNGFVKRPCLANGKISRILDT